MITMRSQALAIENYLSLCRTQLSQVEATGIPAIWLVVTSIGSASVPTQPLFKPMRVLLYPTIDRGMIGWYAKFIYQLVKVTQDVTA